MEYVKLGSSGLDISRLSLGCWNFGTPTPRWGKPGKVTAEVSTQIIHAAMELGINLFDTANRYTGGEAEEILGKAVKGKRHEVLLATKCAGELGSGPNNKGLSRAHIMAEVETSLRRMDTDYIDLYQAHRPDPDTPLEETLRAYDDLIAQGKVRYIGCSNFPAWLLTKALWISDVNKFAKFVSVQPSYSLGNRDVEKELQPMCVDQGIGMILYSPMGGGILSAKYENEIPEGSRGAIEPSVAEKAKKMQNGMNILKKIAQDLRKTPAQVSLNWIVHRPAVSSAIIGVSNVDQLKENIGAIGWKLTDEHIQDLSDAFTTVL